MNLETILYGICFAIGFTIPLIFPVFLNWIARPATIVNIHYPPINANNNYSTFSNNNDDAIEQPRKMPIPKSTS